MEILKELIKKIELQSIVVLLLTMICGYFLLKIDNSFDKPAGILGAISIGFGILYTFVSFSTNQVRENYKDVIVEYKSTITVLKAGNKDVQKSLQSAYDYNYKMQTNGYSSNQDIETQSN